MSQLPPSISPPRMPTAPLPVLPAETSPPAMPYGWLATVGVVLGLVYAGWKGLVFLVFQASPTYRPPYDASLPYWGTVLGSLGGIFVGIGLAISSISYLKKVAWGRRWLIVCTVALLALNLLDFAIMQFIVYPVLEYQPSDRAVAEADRMMIFYWVAWLSCLTFCLAVMVLFGTSKKNKGPAASVAG